MAHEDSDVAMGGGRATRGKRRGKRPFQILALAVAEDGRSVAVSLDLPPALEPVEAPGHWPAGTVRAHIEWEVRQLNADPPAGLVSAAMGGALAMYVDEDGRARRADGSACRAAAADSADGARADGSDERPASVPPVAVYLRITGPAGGAYESARGLRVRLLLDQHYPASAPVVHFLQTVHHFFLDQDNGVPSIFYELLTDLVADLVPPDALPQHTLRATVSLLHHILQSPLHPCEVCRPADRLVGALLPASSAPLLPALSAHGSRRAPNMRPNMHPTRLTRRAPPAPRRSAPPATAAHHHRPPPPRATAARHRRPPPPRAHCPMRVYAPAPAAYRARRLDERGRCAHLT